MEVSMSTDTLNLEVKGSDTVVEKDDKGDFAEFEKQKHILNNKFQEIEDLIVAVYLGSELELCDGVVNIHKFKKTVRNILTSLYLVVVRLLENAFFGSAIQMKKTQ